MPSDSTLVSLISPKPAAVNGVAGGHATESQNNPNGGKSAMPFGGVFKQTAGQIDAPTAPVHSSSTVVSAQLSEQPAANQTDLLRLIAMVQGGEVTELRSLTERELQIQAESLGLESNLADVSVVSWNGDELILASGTPDGASVVLEFVASGLAVTAQGEGQLSLANVVGLIEPHFAAQLSLSAAPLNGGEPSESSQVGLEPLQVIALGLPDAQESLVADAIMEQGDASGLSDSAVAGAVLTVAKSESALIKTSRGSEVKSMVTQVASGLSNLLDSASVDSNLNVVVATETKTHETLTAPQLLQRFMQMTARQTSLNPNLQESAAAEDLTASKVDSTTSSTLSLTSLFATELRQAQGRLHIPVELQFSSPQWSSAVAEKAALLVSQNISRADLQLDPPELGPLQVRVQVQNDQAVVHFVSSNAQVRDALDLTMVRLRELLQEQGLQLLDSSVSDQGQGQQSRERESSEMVDDLNTGQGNLLEEPELIQQMAVTSGIDHFV